MTLTPELMLSIAALGCSIYAVFQTRRNHRLTFRPHLDWQRDRNRTPEGVTFTFTLKNTGVGPAIILDRSFLLDGKRHESELADPVPELAGVCLQNRVHYQLRRHGAPGIRSLLPAGQSICIAEVFFPGLKPEQESSLEKLMNRVDFVSRFQSLSGDTFSFSTASE